MLALDPETMFAFSDLMLGVLAIDGSADVIEFEGAWRRWGELAHVVARVDAALRALGIGPDGRVGVFMRNRPASLAAAIGTIGHGRCLVSINPLLPDDKLEQDIKRLRLPVVIAETADLERPGVLAALRDTGSAAVELLGVLDDARLKPGFEAVTGRDLPIMAPGVIVEMLTSGTTGAPKRVALQRSAFEKSFVGALDYERGRSRDEPPRLRPGRISILVNPITHIGGMWGALSCIVAGGQACLLERFTLEGWRQAIVRHRPKVAAAVPASLRMILDANIPREDLSSLMALRTGTAPLGPEVIAEFWERYEIPVLQNYGATEFSGSVAGWTLPDFRAYHQDKVGSVGRFQAGVVGRIVDPATGAEKPPGEEGVLEMKAAQFGIADQWLRTTDRAIIDADGFLFILGRADNAIIRGGFKVHPDDVVAALHKHPAVREAVVVGLPDRRLGEVPAAAVILMSGAEQPTEADLAAFLREQLLAYQVPARFLFVDDVPRTPSLKPALPQVRDLFTDTPTANPA